jgi:hypothetical protein
MGRTRFMRTCLIQPTNLAELRPQLPRLTVRSHGALPRQDRRVCLRSDVFHRRKFGLATCTIQNDSISLSLPLGSKVGCL